MSRERIQPLVDFSAPDKVLGIEILSPATGRLLPIDAFDANSLGQGVRIQLEKPLVQAPVNGVITKWVPAHASLEIKTKNNLRFLLQLPYAYAEQFGLGVKPRVQVGQSVTKGTPLFELDLYKVQLHLRPVILYVTLLDTEHFKRILVPLRFVEAGKDPLFCLVPAKTANKSPKKQA